MSLEDQVLCVSTTRPSVALSASGGGGSLTIMDPMTGSALSSLRTSADLSGKSDLGISSISAFPSWFNTTNSQLVLAYGGNSTKKGDTYAMLISVRSAPSPPILHWKCRLPEPDMTGGVLVSPCGHYIVGGGSSGTCYVWRSLGGKLMRSFKAHYRACSCMSWSECGRYLVTGGADGMVHLFPLMELVDQASLNSTRAVTPLHTWSLHSFPVTCLTLMNSGRMASGSEDGLVVIMELFSKETVATIKLPHGVRCLTHHDSRLYAGSNKGTVFAIDLDAYAMHQTEKQGASLSKRQRVAQEQLMTAAEKIFGKPEQDENASTRLYQTEWIGHEHAVKSIAFLVTEAGERVISGDDRGQIRVWDVESRTCLKVLNPWSNASPAAGAESKGNTSATQSHPISSVVVVPHPSDTAASGMFATSSSASKGQTSISTLVTPLRRFPDEAEKDAPELVAVPFLRQNRTSASLSNWEARQILRKRKAAAAAAPSSAPESSGTTELLEAKELISKLQKELENKQTEITRWEKVNNKLMSKLKSKK